MEKTEQKDWTGNSKSIHTTLGASNHSVEDREENDYYATEPKAGELLLTLEPFSRNILEPSCGEGHLSKVFIFAGHEVESSDLIDRGFGYISDFLLRKEKFDGDIITNPPYKFAVEFIKKSLELVSEGGKVTMFLKVTFMEGQKRKPLFVNSPPKSIYISSSRIKCVKNGDFANNKDSSAVAYAWYVWHKGFTGATEVKWFN